MASYTEQNPDPGENPEDQLSTYCSDGCPEDSDVSDHVTDLDPEGGEKSSLSAESFVVDFGNRAQSNLQDAFLKYRQQRQRELKKVKRKRKDVPNEARLRAMADPERMWQLRMKFLEQAKKYFGVPYAKKYWKPEDAEYNSKLFLDCCGLVRRVMRDLKKDFGFMIGPWNQAYMCDTLPITIEREEDMKPGDLVFISGTYYNTKMKKQKHSMTHVEIWLGEGQKTIGARWHKGKVQIFDSYKFESTSYHSMKYIFKSIDTWLMGICRSHCPEHAWKTRAQRFIPSKKSVFAIPAEQTNADSDESAGDCSGEEAAPSTEKQQKQHKKVVKKIKKTKRSSKSAQPRLVGTSEMQRMSEQVRLPLSADSKRSVIKTRAQQQQLVLQSLGIQGRAFGQQRARLCQNFMSNSSGLMANIEDKDSAREHPDALSSSDQDDTAPASLDDAKFKVVTSSDGMSPVSYGMSKLTMAESTKLDVMVSAGQKYHRLMQMSTVQTEEPAKSNLLPPLNQTYKSAIITQFGSASFPKPASPDRPASSSTASDHGDSEVSSLSANHLLDINENDHTDQEQISAPSRGNSDNTTTYEQSE